MFIIVNTQTILQTTKHLPELAPRKPERSESHSIVIYNVLWLFWTYIYCETCDTKNLVCMGV